MNKYRYRTNGSGGWVYVESETTFKALRRIATESLTTASARHLEVWSETEHQYQGITYDPKRELTATPQKERWFDLLNAVREVIETSSDPQHDFSPKGRALKNLCTAYGPLSLADTQ